MFLATVYLPHSYTRLFRLLTSSLINCGSICSGHDIIKLANDVDTIDLIALL